MAGKWMDHVMKVFHSRKMSLKQAMKEAKKSYKSDSMGGRKRSRRSRRR